MDIRNLVTPVTPLSEAVKDVLDFCTALKDANPDVDTLLFGRVRPGLKIPGDPPSPVNSPELCLWIDKSDFQNESVQFFPVKGNAMLSFYLYFYAFAKDENGDPVDIQEFRDRFVNYFISKLGQPESGVTGQSGLMPRKFWGFVNPQKIEIDHTNAFKRILEFVPVFPPHYVTRIDIDIWFHNRITI